MSPQADLFPLDRPESVLASCRRLERRILVIAPELTPADCLLMQGQLAIADVVLTPIEERILTSPAYVERQMLTPVMPERGAATRTLLGWPHNIPASLLAPPPWRRRRRAAPAVDRSP